MTSTIDPGNGTLVTRISPFHDTDGAELSALPVSLSTPPSTGVNAAATATDAGSGTDDEAITGAAAGLRLLGFSAQEDAGGDAELILHNGTGTGDPATFIVSLSANESRSEWFGPDGIVSAGGIYLERVSGTSRVVVHHKTVS